jgi:hypothetical protein
MYNLEELSGHRKEARAVALAASRQAYKSGPMCACAPGMPIPCGCDNQGAWLSATCLAGSPSWAGSSGGGDGLLMLNHHTVT